MLVRLGVDIVGRNSKIGQFCLSTWVKKNVSSLYVSVDLFILVKILDSFQSLLQNCSDLVLVQLHFCYPDQVDYGTRRTVLHHDP